MIPSNMRPLLRVRFDRLVPRLLLSDTLVSNDFLLEVHSGVVSKERRNVDDEERADQSNDLEKHEYQRKL